MANRRKLKNAVEYIKINHMMNTVLVTAVNDCRKCNLLHDKYDLLYLINGGNEMIYRHKQITGQNGTVEIFEPGEIHTTEKIYSPGNYYVLSIDYEELKRYSSENYGVDVPHFVISKSDNEKMKNIFKRLINILQRKHDKLEVEDIFSELIHTLLMTSSENSIKDYSYINSVKLLRVRDYMQENFFKDYSMDELAHIGCMSKYHFIRSFKEYFGTTPHQYRMQLIINYAKNEIENKRNPEVLYYYSDQSHYIRHFRNVMGVTPKKYSKIF
ncbi:MAG: helix-turn-helix transcriptional regulator [Candidatus Latescibacteria bacterium]|nr:helix-turn-helix transcriptional regulator [Candidatus Latescibacterota bacterium]